MSKNCTLTSQDVQDLVAITIVNLGRASFLEISQRIGEYEVFSRWFRMYTIQDYRDGKKGTRDRVTWDIPREGIDNAAAG